MQAYLKRDIAKHLGKSPKVIQTWTDMGLVNPDLIPSQGRGISRVYSSLNLLQFAFCDELLKCRGMTLAAIKWILDKIRLESSDEDSFKRAIKRSTEGDLLFTGDLDNGLSFNLMRSRRYDVRLAQFVESLAHYTINLSKIIEKAEARI
jgi:DNA-binding transcriptional MerR regulator